MPGGRELVCLIVVDLVTISDMFDEFISMSYIFMPCFHVNMCKISVFSRKMANVHTSDVPYVGITMCYDLYNIS